MKKRFVTMFAAVLCVVLLSYVFSPAKLPAGAVIAAEEEPTAPCARFLNMLNHNYVYNEGFESFDSLTRGAVIASLGLREGDYVQKAYIKGFLADMYGINAVSFTQDTEAEEKSGYLYIVPSGYTRYVHSDPAVSENEDGTFTVITEVTVYPHDAAAYETVAVSLFAPNKNSSFGYVIVYSNLDPVTVVL